jgi:hypothetical protein
MGNVLVDARIAGERAAAAQSVREANEAMAQLKADYAASPEQRAVRDREQLSRLQSDPYFLDKQIGGNTAALNEQAVLEARIRQAEAAALAEVENKAARVDLAIQDIVDQSAIETTFGDEIPVSDFVDAVQDDVRLGVNPDLIQRVLTTGTHGIPGADKLADVWYERYARSPEMQEAHKRGDPTICLQAAKAKYYKTGACDGPLSDDDVAVLRRFGARI